MAARHGLQHDVRPLAATRQPPGDGNRDSDVRDALWWPIVMNNAKARQSGAGWIPVACLLAIGALLGLSTILAKLAWMHGLSALPFLAWSLRDLLYGEAQRRRVTRHFWIGRDIGS